MSKKPLPGPRKHHWVGAGDDDFCNNCGLDMTDNQEPTGCEAPPEGNSLAYVGTALTPIEQELDLRREKMRFHADFAGDLSYLAKAWNLRVAELAEEAGYDAESLRRGCG